MRLTPTERDRLLLFGAAELARARRARGLRLNVPEATALIADTVCEAARDGWRLGEAVEAARAVLGRADVLPGVAELVDEVQVEAVFEDGTRLAVVTSPLGEGTGEETSGAPGAVLPGSPPPAPPAPRVTLTVRNTASVPISVTSHFHFFEANPRLSFDRSAAYGMRLAVPAGSSLRFEPGGTREAGLVPIGGARVAIGFAGLVDGPLDAPGAREEALRKAAACGYLGAGEHPEDSEAPVDPEHPEEARRTDSGCTGAGATGAGGAGAGGAGEWRTETGRAGEGPAGGGTTHDGGPGVDPATEERA